MSHDLGLSRAWWATFSLLSIALVLPLWLVTYPPGVDLPQHAAQVAIGMHWFDDGLPYREFYAFNPLSQSLIAHGLASLFSTLFPVVTALKLTISLALLAIPLVSLRLIRAVDGDPWWVFASFPIAHSFTAYWGFLNFIVGVPLALLLVSVAVSHARQPTRRRLVTLAVLPLVVFLGHILALGFGGIAAAAVVCFGLRGRERIKALGALAAVLPIILAWFVGLQLSAPNSTGIQTILGLGFDRVLRLPNYMVGIPSEMTYAALGMLTLISPFVAGARFVRFGWRWAPLVSALALYFLLPRNVMGTAYIFPRYAVFIVPSLFIALRPAAGLGRANRAGRALIAAVALVTLATVNLRFAAFEREAKSFEAVVAKVEPGTRVLGLIYGPGSDAIPYPVYLHWVAWLQVERRAMTDFSFAEFFPNRFRYQTGKDPKLPDSIEWMPHRFRWSEHGGNEFDYFLIRNSQYGAPHQFVGADLELVIESRPWLLVRRRP